MSATTLEAPSPRNLSRLRNNRDAQSTSSLASSSSNGHEPDESTGLKATLSHAMDKVRKSVDERRESIADGSSPSRRLSTLFKRNKKNERRSSSQLGEGHSSQEAGKSDASLAPPSRRSSLLTDEGDEGIAARPTLSAHNSHHGFLTLSSPTVNAAAETESAVDPAAAVQLDTALVPSIVEPTVDDANESAKSTAPRASPHQKSVSALPKLESANGSQQDLTRGRATEAAEQPRPETPLAKLALTTSEPATPPGKEQQTPETVVTPPTPLQPSGAGFGSPDQYADGGVRRRRALSGGKPSNLSRSIPAPLTPTVEEAKTPGGTYVQGTNASGFFSSVFSVAQKAADQLSSTISVPSVIKGSTANDTTAVDSPKSPASALRTSPDMGSTTDLGHSQNSTESEQEAAARAVSNAYEKPVSQQTNGRPLSVASHDHLALDGQQDGDALKRTGSVRSKISARRHRGSSAATGTSGIGAALRESATGLSNIASSGQGHRATGFAVASKKRNKDFHSQFRSVPEDDYLIEDYSAALQRDILLHGRLYVSEGHICFSSNILGWITNLVMSFDEIVSVEKKSTAVIFPNAIVIQTVSARNTFASFVARDSTYELIIGIWKINHPHLKSSLNGVALENAGTGDKTEKAESVGSNESDTESDEFYDEDEEEDAGASYVEGSPTKSVAGSDAGDATEKSKPAAAEKNEGKSSGDTKAKESTESPSPNGKASGGTGPDSHAPTECSDEDEHYDRALNDATIQAPLGKVYDLMWGPASGAFMSKWLVDEQKCRELDLKDDKIGLDNDHKSTSLSYIKPLGGSIGPKQTKCLTTNTLEQFDLEKVVTVSCSTQTPDVPSGNVFLTKTRYCLTWGPNNSTRLVANCTIEWSGKSWLKGPIEKGAQDGQTQYAKDIVAALKAATSAKGGAKGGARKGRKKGKAEDEEVAKEEAKPAEQANTGAGWGPLEPLHSILEPVMGILPYITIAVLAILLTYSWFFSSAGRSGVAHSSGRYPSQPAMYEQLWQREEEELWDWLEDRVGLNEVYAAKLEDRRQRQKSVASKKMGNQVAEEKMNQRQLDEAIEITQERLEALKEAVGRRKIKAESAPSIKAEL